MSDNAWMLLQFDVDYNLAIPSIEYPWSDADSKFLRRLRACVSC
jgi:hypothetical protein